MAKKYKSKSKESIEPETLAQDVETEQAVDDVVEIKTVKKSNDKQAEADQLREIQRKRLLGLI